MTPPLIVPIVEGQGEVEALPLLLRRIAAALPQPTAVRVNPPIRVKSGSFLSDDAYFSKYVSLAAAKAAQGSGLVLILLDCEDDCPAKVGPVLLNNARSVRSDVPHLVALAYREYETWFLAAAESLRGIAGLPQDLSPPPDPERIRGAKEWLSRHLSTRYKEVLHQPAFSQAFDFGQAESISSFQRFRQRLEAHLAPLPPP